MLRTLAYAQCSLWLFGAIVSGMPNLLSILQSSNLFNLLGDFTEVYFLFIKRPLENVILALGLQPYSPLIDAGVIWSTAVQISGVRTGLLPQVQLSLRAKILLTLLGPYLRAVMGVIALLAIMMFAHKVSIELYILFESIDPQFDAPLARRELGTAVDYASDLLEYPEIFYFILLIIPLAFFTVLSGIVENNTHGSRRGPFDTLWQTIKVTPRFIWYYSFIVATALLGRLLDGQLSSSI